MYKRLLKLLFIERLRHALFGRQEGQQWCRVVMDQETEKLVKALPYSSFAALEISGTKWSDFGFKKYNTVAFPEFDICKDVLPEKYDLIIAEQVFEHILWPYRGARNVHEMLQPNGYLLITTPFLIKVHDFPQDCSRWTETGIKYFLAECGFPLEKIHTGSWGNIESLVSNLNQWTAYQPGRHSLVNEKDYPLVVWALAQK